tara:strand:+ start:198 stop:875 length:678 start_codon:yes stop_codon:yes gene_type:complete
MCAIFGGVKPSIFEILYEANKQRGTFASSVVGLTENDQHVFKKSGGIDFDKFNYIDDTLYYLGHVQAPTSAKRTWLYGTSHPFESLSWLVSHNGVLTNHDKLKRRYCSFLENPVDTAVIVHLLEYFTQLAIAKEKKIKPVKIIKNTLKLLEGTYALSILDCNSNDVYLARSGSILHYSKAGGYYSSMPGSNLNPVPEGTILKLNKKTKKWNKAGTFDFVSPFSFI